MANHDSLLNVRTYRYTRDSDFLRAFQRVASRFAIRDVYITSREFIFVIGD